MKKSELVDEKIAKLTDWRGKMCSQLRNLIFEVDPEISRNISGKLQLI